MSVDISQVVDWLKRQSGWKYVSGWHAVLEGDRATTHVMKDPDHGHISVLIRIQNEPSVSFNNARNKNPKLQELWDHVTKKW